jgi:hypothetical protein
MESMPNKQQRSNYKRTIIQGILQGQEMERRSPKDKKSSSSDNE